MQLFFVQLVGASGRVGMSRDMYDVILDNFANSFYEVLSRNAS